MHLSEARLRRAGHLEWCERPGSLLMMAFVLALVLLSRKPAVLLHAELWGDDGWSWYPDAYRVGWHSLLLPVGGYLNTFQRIVGLAVQPFPLTWVPTLFALAGLAAQLAPIVFLVSGRMRRVIPDARLRVVLAFVLVGMPNTVELYVNLTNAQWNLALLAFLVLLASPPVRPWERGFDIGVLVLSGLSGPFCLLLVPIAAWQVYERRSRADLVRTAILCAAACVQIGCLLQHPHAGRSLAPLGAGPRMLARIVSGQVLLGAELGYKTFGTLTSQAIWQSNVLPLATVSAGAAVCAVALIRGKSDLRKLALFAGLVFASALLSPQVSATSPQWAAMTLPLMGNRYYAFPMLAWVAMLVTLCVDRSRTLRLTGAALALVMVVWAIPHDWAEPTWPSTDFLQRARAFAGAAAGTRMEFPIIPPGLSPMILVKKADSL